MKKPKAPRLLTVAIFTTITIIFWIFISVYMVLTSKPDVNVPPEILAPINPQLDSQALNDLAGREYYDENEVPEDFVPPQPASGVNLTPEVPEENEEETPEETPTPTEGSPTPTEATPTPTGVQTNETP
jgi:hypothetical protein